MQDYKAFLKANPNGVLATAVNGQPHTRIFQYLWDEDGKIFFCTATTKDVFKELQANPNVSFCTWDPMTFEVLRLNGAAHFMDDAARKARVLEENPAIKGIYKDAANPIFTIFYVDVREAGSFSFSEGTRSVAMK